ncbi:TerD family protein [Nocardia australiensis]|uniref:TerD family protein n=1 Tax=Nocardia australiensis TaxID=2887191 RepID=UPI001D156C61|nr:TerD family protein [Nocardia australiensis]
MFITLRDESGTALDYVTMALGWDPVRTRRRPGSRSKDIDLNAAALLFAGNAIADVVYHEQLISRDGSVRHLGDSTTGEGKGDNEIITVDLTRLAPEVTTVIFVVTSYTGQTFEQIENAFCRAIDGVSGIEIARYDLSGGGAYTGLVMGRVVRADGFWQFESIGEGIRAQHPVEAVAQLTAFVM